MTYLSAGPRGCLGSDAGFHCLSCPSPADTPLRSPTGSNESSIVGLLLATPQRPSPPLFAEEGARLRQQVRPAGGRRAVGRLGPAPGPSAAGRPPPAVAASVEEARAAPEVNPLTRTWTRTLTRCASAGWFRGWEEGQERPGHQESLAARGPPFPGSADPQPPEFCVMGGRQAPGWPASESRVLADRGTGLF